MSTREGILDTALSLFNRWGTGAKSTNHIAAAHGISPGNLYYHFRNKQEIIRGLFRRMYAMWDKGLPLPSDRAPGLVDLQRVVEAGYHNIWKYRFAYRELVALLQEDPLLRREWLEFRQRGFDGFLRLFNALVDGGVMRRPKDPAELGELHEICWLISEFWISNLEVGGRPVSATSMKHGAQLMLRVLQPYLA